jgi:hypothetical protein
MPPPVSGILLGKTYDFCLRGEKSNTLSHSSVRGWSAWRIVPGRVRSGFEADPDWLLKATGFRSSGPLRRSRLQTEFDQATDGVRPIRIGTLGPGVDLVE